MIQGGAVRGQTSRPSPATRGLGKAAYEIRGVRSAVILRIRLSYLFVACRFAWLGEGWRGPLVIRVCPVTLACVTSATI